MLHIRSGAQRNATIIRNCRNFICKNGVKPTTYLSSQCMSVISSSSNNNGIGGKCPNIDIFYKERRIKCYNDIRWKLVQSFSTTSTASTIPSIRRQEKQKTTKQIKIQYDELVHESKKFLKSYDQIKSIEKRSMQMQQLVFRWGPLLTEKRGKAYKRKGPFTYDTTIEGIEIVDQLVHKLLDEVQQRLLAQKEILRIPVSTLVYISLGAWSKAPPNGYNGVKAQELVQRMDFLHKLDKSNQLKIQPNTACYGSVIRAWANTTDSNNGENINGAVMAEKTLTKMQMEYSNGQNKYCKPNLKIYNTCLHAYAQRGMFHEIEALIDKLEKMKEKDAELTPDVYSYTILMNAYAKCKSDIDGISIEKRAENLLMQMWHKFKKSGDRRFMPSQYTFGTVLNIFLESRLEDAAVDADRILCWLIKLAHEQKAVQQSTQTMKGDTEKYPFLFPNKGNFKSVFLNYLKRKDKHLAIRRIEELLLEMETLSEAGFTDCQPTYEFFVIYLDAIVNSMEDAEEKAHQVLKRVESIYLSSHEAFEYNNYGYNLLMHCIARSPREGRTHRAQALINRMNTLYTETGNKMLKPDKISYTSLMKAIMMDKEPGFVTKCKSILNEMWEEYAKGNERLKPDVFAYGTVLNAMSDGALPEESEALLDEMEKLAMTGEKEFYPSIICYNTVMNAYAKRRRHDAAKQTERIFNRINEARRKGNSDLEPNDVSYSIYIMALAKSDDLDKVQKAESIFNKWRDQYSSKTRSFSPTSVWSSLLFLYAESKLEDKVEKMLSMIKQMEECNQIDTISYNILLKGCSKSNRDSPEQRKRILEISQVAFKALNDGKRLRADAYSYTTLLHICDKFIDDPSEKQATIKAFFRRCCEDGEVNESLFRTFKRVSSHDTYLEATKIGENMVVNSYDDLPMEWKYRHDKSKKK